MGWLLASGDVLSHYRVVSPLGTGGMGEVYLAEDVRLQRRLALKILSPGARRDDELLHRFEREARTISALNHPNILTVYDVGRSGDTQFLATEYVDGVTLRQVVERGPVPPRRAVEIAIQVTQALAAAHDAGVIHRDLKPENVMIRADGYVKVLDFGLAKLTGQEAFGTDADSATRLLETKDGLVLGTFNYMAPEQARGGDLDQRADLFALGVLLYEMLTGVPPFKGQTAADVVGALLFRDPAPVSATIDVPPALDTVIGTCLSKDRDERYPSSAALLADLRALRPVLAAGGPVAANPTSLPLRPAETQAPQAGIGRIMHFGGRFDEAARQYDHVLQANPGFGQARIDLAMTEMARGDFAAARAQLDRAEEVLGAVSTIVLLRGCCAVRRGAVADGRAAFVELRSRYDRAAAGADDLALLAATLGDAKTALDWLTEACAQRSPFLGYVDVEPAMAPLLHDAACRGLLQRYGFTATPRAGS